jgi:hypothetical protein
VPGIRANTICRRTILSAGVGLFLLASMSIAGCMAFQPRDEPALNAAATGWNTSLIRQHLRFLNQTEPGTRSTGSQGFANAAQYITNFWKELAIGGAYGSDPRQLYRTRINLATAASLVLAEGDTLRFRPGVDFYPDARTDSGRVHSGTLVAGGVRALTAAQRLPSLTATSEDVTYEDLVRIRDLGARALLLVRRMRLSEAPAAVDGLIVMQVTLDTAIRLMDRPAAQLALVLAAPEVEEMTLAGTLGVRATTERHERAGAMNVLGLISGKDPAWSSDLVIVCAELDGPPVMAGARYASVHATGAGVVALLEVSRVLSLRSRTELLPERSVLLGFLSGSGLDYAGLRAYLARPAWPVGSTVSVVYVGAPPEREAALQAIFEEHGIDFISVPVEPFFPGSIVPVALNADAAPYVTAAGEIVPALASTIMSYLLREAGERSHDAPVLISPSMQDRNR